LDENAGIEQENVGVFKREELETKLLEMSLNKSTLKIKKENSFKFHFQFYWKIP
jgi:hypothetical protein